MYIKTFWEQHCSICEMTLWPWKNYPVTNGLKSGERCGPLASNNTWLEEKTFQYQHFGKVIIARSKIIISIPDLECILFNFTQSRYDRNMVIHSMSSSQRQGFVSTELHFVWSSVLNHKALTLWRWFHICLISLLIPFHSESDNIQIL